MNWQRQPQQGVAVSVNLEGYYLNIPKRHRQPYYGKPGARQMLGLNTRYCSDKHHCYAGSEGRKD